MSGYFKGSTTKDAVGYSCGEDIEFRLELTDGKQRFGCPLFKWEMYGDDGRSSQGMTPGESGEIVLHTSLSSPGFIHVIVTACAHDGSPLETIDKFEGGAGVMYFDTAIQAKRVTCPVEITCGLGDYVCPPSTEVVLWHNFKTPKKITFVQNMTHPYRPREVISYTR